MARWSMAQLAEYENRRRLQGSKPEPTVRHEPLAEEKGAGQGPGRIPIRIVSYRCRLLDTDNICVKHALDCVKYAGLIKDDAPQFITLTVEQFKVKTKTEERTEILIGRDAL